MFLLQRVFLIKEEVEYRLFKYAIFLLPSAFPMAALLLLISLILSFKKRGLKIFKEGNDYLPLIFIFLVSVSSFKSFFSNIPGLENFNKSLLFVGTLNWLSMIIIYYACKNFVDTKEKKKQVITYLITGSVPVIATIFALYFFK